MFNCCTVRCHPIEARFACHCSTNSADVAAAPTTAQAHTFSEGGTPTPAREVLSDPQNWTGTDTETGPTTGPGKNHAALPRTLVGLCGAVNGIQKSQGAMVLT